MARVEKLTKAEVKKLTAGLKPGVHFHSEPRCKGGVHSKNCDGKGAEITCNLVKVLGKRICACLHV